MFVLSGCWSSVDEEKLLEDMEEEKEVKSVEVGVPTEVSEDTEKEETKPVEKEGAKETSKEEAKPVEEVKLVCDNDVCAGKVLIKCVLQKSTYNTTCPDECKNGK